MKVSPLDLIPHALVVYAPADEDDPQYARRVIAFPDKPSAELAGKRISSYGGVEYEIVNIEEPITEDRDAAKPLPTTEYLNMGPEAQALRNSVLDAIGIYHRAVGMASRDAAQEVVDFLTIDYRITSR